MKLGITRGTKLWSIFLKKRCSKSSALPVVPSISLLFQYLIGLTRRGIILLEANPMSSVFRNIVLTLSPPGECVPHGRMNYKDTEPYMSAFL
jgi:hypothetical protein